MERRRRFVKNRSRCWVHVMTTGITGPRLALLRSLVTREGRHSLTFWAVRVYAVFRVAIAPQPFKAGRIVGEFPHEFDKGHFRI